MPDYIQFPLQAAQALLLVDRCPVDSVFNNAITFYFKGLWVLLGERCPAIKIKGGVAASCCHAPLLWCRGYHGHYCSME